MTVKASSADTISDTDAPLCCCFVWHNYKVLNFKKERKKRLSMKKDTAIKPPYNHEVNSSPDNEALTLSVLFL